MWGLENSKHNPAAKKTVRARIARYSYGVSFACVFDESKGHRWEDRRRTPDGVWRAINQMGWLLEKGDKVEEGKMLHIPLTANTQVGLLSTGMRYFSDQLYHCADDDPPSRRETSKLFETKTSTGIIC